MSLMGGGELGAFLRENAGANRTVGTTLCPQQGSEQHDGWGGKIRIK
jgi:hypothetical protein